jgi:DNA-binding MarR family transcriptional regulator
MNSADDLLRLLVGAHTLARVASLETHNDAPAAQWRNLSLLRDHGPQRLGELATLSRVTQPGMTRLATQLADAGLISRSADPGDSRVSILSITDAGQLALREWLDLLATTLAPRLSALDDEDRAALRRSADIITTMTLPSAVAR